MGGAINKYVLLLLVLIIDQFGFGQNVFNKSYDVINAPNLSSNALETQGGYIFTQVADYNGFSHIQVFKIDTLGNFVDSNTVIQSTKTLFYGYAGSLQKLTNNEYCQLYKIGPDSALRLVLFDENLNILNDIEFTLGLFSAPGLISQINDSTILVLGQVINSGKWDLILINTDLQGNERWRTIFGEPGKDDYGFAIEYVNNKILVGGQTYYTGQVAHPHIFEFNNAGQLLFDTTYTQFDNGGEIMYTNTHGLYQFCSRNNYPTSVYPILLKINPDYSIQWSKEYFKNEKFVAPGNVTMSNDGIISIAGTFKVNGLNSGFFFQANQNGDSLGMKLINHISGELAQFQDIRPTSDGGFILAGETDAPTQDSWIVKVNAWGCDNIPCIVSVPEVAKTQGLLTCYPNPSSGTGTVKGSFENANSTNQIKVFNSLGQLVFVKTIATKEFEIEVNLPGSGLYLVSLYQNNLRINQQKWVVR